MKNIKFILRPSRLVQISFIGAYLAVALAGCFSLTASTARAAACNYSLTFNQPDGSNQTTNATLSQTLSFVTTITASGDLATCNNQSLTLDVMSDRGSSAAALLNDYSNVVLNNGSATVYTSVNLAQNQSRFLNSTTARIKAVLTASLSSVSTTVQTSAIWTVNISNIATAGSGGETVTISPTKASYGPSDSLTISAAMSSSAYSQAQSSGVQNVYFNILVNGQSGYDETTVPLSSFNSQAAVQYGTMDLTTANGFHDGSNTITVELWSAGTSIKLSTASISFQMQGTSGNGPQITLTPSATNSTYAPGAQVTVTASNMPSDGILIVKAGSQNLKLTSSDHWSTVLTLDQNSGFNISGSNSIVASPVAADGVTALAAATTFGITISANANSGQTPGSNNGTAAPVNCSGPSPDPNNCIYNPLPVDSLTATLLLIMKGFLGILGLWAVAFIVIGGFRLVMSQGNEEAVTAARKTITWAIIGLAIALLSFSIVAIVQYLLLTKIQNVSSSTSFIPEYRISRKVG